MSISVKNIKAPVLRRISKGKVNYCFRKCPYSTDDYTNRVPTGERTIHTVTSGNMSLKIKDGHDRAGFICLDPNCSYYLGTAVTELTTLVEIPNVNRTTGEYTVSGMNIPIPLCSGTHFFEY
jgi:hypothetical protein